MEACLLKPPPLRPPPDPLRRRCLAAGLAALLLALVMLGWRGPVPPLHGAHTSFLTVHLLLELVAVVIAALIATVAWHAAGVRERRTSVVAIGGFLVVAVCDLVHALTYEGMPAFLGAGSTPKAIFFWLMGRSAELITLLLLAMPSAVRITPRQSLGAGLVLVALLMAWGASGPQWFPTTFVPGQGVTPFKAGFEALLCLANVATAVLWWRRGNREGDTRAHLIATASWVIGIGELCFVSYQAPSDFINIAGHVYKIAGYALLYHVMYLTQVRHPVLAMQQAQARAEDGEQRLRALADNLPATVVYQLAQQDDGRYAYMHMSESLERMLGYPATELLADGSLLRRHVLPQDLPVYDTAALKAVRQQTPLDVTVRVAHRNGGWRWLHIVSAPRVQADGSLVWDGLATDVTAVRIAETQHRENEAMLAAVIGSASDAVISTGADGRINLFNPAAERIFGHAAAAMLGQPLDRLLPPGVADRHRADMAGFACSGSTGRQMAPGRVRGRRADGSELQLEASISQVTVNDRQLLTAILRDVTERVRSEKALLQSQRELTDLAHRLMDQEKRTSRQLAQVLHDQLGQTLTAMRIDFVTETSFDDPALGRRHARVDALIDQAVREVRQVLVDLRPTLLDERGLVEALHNELDTRQRGAEGIALQLEAAPSLQAQRWHADVEYAAFMVAREALGNAVRHARPCQVRVAVAGGPDWLTVSISDDGSGLSADDLHPRPGHLGMVGMRERSVAIGGRFSVQPRAGGGTVVTLHWEDTAT